MRPSQSTALAVFPLLAVLACIEPRVETAPAAMPEPAFVDLENPFTGGEVTVLDAAETGTVTSTLFTYFDGRHWVILGRDIDVAADGGERLGRWSSFWDVGGLPAGEYWLRAEMTTQGGGYGQTRLLVHVAHLPEGRVGIQSERRGQMTLSAAELSDPDGGALAHTWVFATDAFEGPTVSVPSAPMLAFTHNAVSALGASAVDTYLFLPGVLLSLANNEVTLHLDFWRTRLANIIREKTALKAQLPQAAQDLIDEANAAMERARVKLGDAKTKLTATPPDEAGAQSDLADARREVAEAIGKLEAIQPRPEAIRVNISLLRNLFQTLGVTMVEADTLVGRLDMVRAVMGEKTALIPLLPAQAAAQVQAVVALLARCAELLEEALEALLSTPPNLARARQKIEEARELLEQAAGILGGALGLAGGQAQTLLDNIEKLKVLHLDLGFLAGKLWLLEEIGLSDAHAGIGPPTLTRDAFPHFDDPVDIQMGRPPGNPMDDNAWDDAVLYHELDHYFLYQKEHQTLEGGKHWYDEDLSESQDPAGAAGTKRGEQRGRELAWSEGWANFSSCAKRKDPTYLDENEDTQPADAHFTIEKDLENDLCRNTGEAAMHPVANSGPDVEGSVSGTLWDLFDGPANGLPDADADGISIEFVWFWRAINLPPPPESILDFSVNLKKVLTDNGVAFDQAKFDKAFTDHGLTPP